MIWINSKFFFRWFDSRSKPHDIPLLQNTHVILDLSAQNSAGNTAVSLASFYNMGYLFPSVSLGQGILCAKNTWLCGKFS